MQSDEIQTLFGESSCYVCYGTSSLEALELALLARWSTAEGSTSDTTVQSLLDQSACTNCSSSTSITDLLQLALLEQISDAIDSEDESFTPLDRGAALVAWYKADTGVYSDAGTTPAIDGGNVQQWNDQSGNNKHLTQATSGDRPLYQTGIQNSLPGIQFVSSDWLALGSALISDFPLTMYVVTRSSATSIQWIAGLVNTGVVGDWQALFYSGSALGSLFWMDSSASGSDTPAVTSASYSLDTVYLVTGSVAAANSRSIWMNSSSLGIDATVIDPAGINEFSIGMARDSTPSFPLTGYIMELIVTNQADDASQRAQMEAYLAEKWNVP